MRNVCTRMVAGCAAGLLAVVLLAGCGSDPVQPLLEPQIVNETDTFQFQATTNGQTTQSFQYSWQNTGTSANVDQSTVLDYGGAVVTITDADGTQVYSRDLAQDGSFSTSQGVAGSWTIRVALTKAVGGLNFRAEKP
jgi:hypothetical protein